MELSKTTAETFASALKTLTGANIPFLVGGAFAMQHYTGFLRNTKDLDIFLYKRNVGEAMAKLAEAGFVTKIHAEHWLAKAFKGNNCIDLIFGSGNWVMRVDASFFERSVGGELLGIPVKFLAPEEIIWSKSYVAARERFDGSDIVHLINATRGQLDWHHLLKRLGKDWQLLLADVLLYGFVFPSERDYVPSWLVEDLTSRMRQVMKEPPPTVRVCRGTLLDRYSFVPDVEKKGYLDPREQLAVKSGYSADQVEKDRSQARSELQIAPG